MLETDSDSLYKGEVLSWRKAQDTIEGEWRKREEDNDNVGTPGERMDKKRDGNRCSQNPPRGSSHEPPP